MQRTKAKLGDLVRTPEGYYGIVSDMEQKCVFQGNGMEAFIDDEDWDQLAVMPLNIFKDVGVSNFMELLTARQQLARVVATGFTFDHSQAEESP
jgi:hypothetical protein